LAWKAHFWNALTFNICFKYSAAICLKWETFWPHGPYTNGRKNFFKWHISDRRFRSMLHWLIVQSCFEQAAINLCIYGIDHAGKLWTIMQYKCSKAMLQTTSYTHTHTHLQTLLNRDRKYFEHAYGNCRTNNKNTSINSQHKYHVKVHASKAEQIQNVKFSNRLVKLIQATIIQSITTPIQTQ